MAESYRGLTIRIGGDTTKLTQALRAANGAISGTQSELRKLDQAMRMDPSSMESVRLQAGYLASQAENTALKLRTMREAYDQAAATTMEGQAQTMAELAEQTENAQLRAAQAKDAYNALTQQIAQMHTQLSDLYRTEAQGAAKGMSSAFSVGTDDGTGAMRQAVEGLLSALGRLPEGVSASKSAVRELAKEAEVLAASWERASDEAARQDAIDRFEELKSKALALSSVKFSFDRENVDIESLREAIEGLDPELRKSLGDTEEWLATARQLKGAFKESLDELRASNELVSMEDANVEATRLEASLRKVASTWAETAKRSALADELGNSQQELARVDSALQSAATRFLALDRASKAVPTNARLAGEASQALATATGLAQQKMAMLASASSKIDASGAGELAQEFGSLDAAVEGATARAVEMRVAYEKALAALDDALTAYAKDNNLGQGWVEQAKHGVAELTLEVSELPEGLRETASAAMGARQAADDAMGSMSTAYACKQQQELRDELSRTEASVQSAFGTELTPKIDEAAFMQAVDRVAAYAQRAMSSITDASATLDSAYRDMRKTVDATESQYEQLRDAAIEFSQTHVTTADQMLEMESLAGQMGVAADELQRFAEVAANLDIATDIDAETIALQMGQISNVMSDLDASNVQGFADALVRLGNNMPAQESAIMAVAQRLSAVADVAGISTPEVLAWSAAIAATGQRSEAAATAISNTITEVESAVAGGGEALGDFAIVAGMSAEDFAAAWSDSPTRALQAFVQGLSSLRETDEGAIAALEAMGISGVRQQQTLLGLAQTVDTLDDALLMSQDAWSGVSDRWGRAGDAANEASQKSEGFSGALGVMQNSATALAATMGDGLVPLMQVATGAIQALTTILDALPGPVRSILVAGGGLVTLFSTVTPLVETFGNGWEAMLAKAAASKAPLGQAAAGAESAGAAAGDAVAGTRAEAEALDEVAAAAGSAGAGLAEAAAQAESAGSRMGAAAAGARSVGDAAEAGSAAASGLGAAMAGLGGILQTGAFAVGITAAITLIGAIVGHLEELHRRQEEAKAATEGLAEATERGRAAYDGYAESASRAAVSVADVRDAANEAIASQADLAARIEDMWSETAQAEAVVDGYVAKIGELSSKSSLTAMEQTALAEAVRGFDEATGSSLEVVSESAGELSMTADAIGEVAQAFSDLSDTETARKALDELNDQLALDKARLAEVEAQMAATGHTYEELAAMSDGAAKALASSAAQANGVTVQTASSTGALASSASALTREYDELVRGIATAESAIAQQESIIAGAGRSYASLEAALIAAGYTSAQWASLTKEQLAEVEKAYKKSLGAAEAKLAEYGVALGGTVEAAASAWSGASGVAEAISGASDDEVKAQQKANDVIYKEAKAGLDREYKERQRAYDSEYKLLQKQLDAVYKARQKELAAEEDALKRANDAELNALKKANDAAYDERKKANDAQYDQLKDQLDAIEAEHKKANERYLKDLKKRNQAEVKEFKAATDARVAEIRREYEERIKALEDNDESKGIDSRIAELEAETEAEQAAAKERERNEKTTQLRLAVEQAKTRRTKADAEKALSDYLAQLAQEDREAQRKAEIRALEDRKADIKDEVAAQKEALQEERDARIDSLKESREAELEALQDALDARYDAEKERLDAIEEEHKRANAARLAAFKDELAAELEALKESNDATYDDLKARLDARVDAMRDAHTAELEALKDGQSQQLDTLKQHQQDQLDYLRETHQTQLDDLKQSQSDQLDAMRAGGAGLTSAAADTSKRLMDDADATGKYVGDSVAASGGVVVGKVMATKAKVDSLSEGAKAKLLSIAREAGSGVNSAASSASGVLVSKVSATGSQIGSLSDGAKAKLLSVAREASQGVEAQARSGADRTTSIVGAGGQSAVSKVASYVGPMGGAARDLANAATNAVAPVEGSFSQTAQRAASNFASGIGSGAPAARSSGDSLANAAYGPVNSVQGWTYTSGSNLGINFANGISSAYQWVVDAANSVANAVASILHHSTPEEGPLRDDDEWGADLVQNIIDGMRERERDLASQAERMAEIVERGFDPTLTLDAAHEAMDAISAGEARAAAATARTAAEARVPDVSISVSVSLSDVRMADEASVSALASRLAREVERRALSRIGA